MDNKNDVLSRIFHSRLKDYKERPDTELWSKIEADLKENNSIKKPAVWKWIGLVAAVAAIVFICMIKFIFIENENSLPLNDHSTAMNIDKEQISPIEVVMDEKQKPVIETINKTESKKLITQNLSVKNKKGNEEIRIKTASKVVDNDINEFSPTNNIEKSSEKKTADTVVTEENNETENQKVKVTTMPLIADTSPEEWDTPQKSNTNKNPGLSLALAMGNTGTGGLSGSSSDNNSPGLKSLTPSYNSQLRKNGYSTIGTDYSIPIAVGFYVRKHLSKNWAIESGLSYTYLESKEILTAVNKSEMNRETKLNYLGIPINAVYSFINQDRFSMYALGGAMVEKCIYGQEKSVPSGMTNEINVPEIQCSVSGAIGINYRLIRHLGLFIEPGLSYYFDDGSEIKTIRKDTPLNFEIQGGIRLVY